MVAGVRRLRLRNLIDRIGKQEYFDTLKLQFGFTLRGAKKRLPEWLSGLEPMSARILSGQDPSYSDLKSDSFTKMWQTLKRFRDRVVAEEYARHVLSNSPWIRPDWTDVILQAAYKPSVPRPATGTSVLDEAEAPARVSGPAVEPVLEWPEDSRPRLVLRMAEENFLERLAGLSTAEFVIDSKVVDRWTRLGEGLWRGRRDLICPEIKGKINLRPQLMVIRSESTPVYELDSDELGLSGPMILFDLKSGRAVNPRSSLSTNRDYALICDSDLSVQGASKIWVLSSGRAYRVPGGLLDSLTVTCEGATYWLPSISERKKFEPFDVVLEFENGFIAPIDSVVPVLLRGVPGDAVTVSLTVGDSTYPAFRREDFWKTERGVKIDLKLALGEERVRVFVIGAGYARSLSPRPQLRLRGIAQRRTSEGGDPEWAVVRRGSPLDRLNGIGQARLFAGEVGEPLYEGYSEIGKVSSRALDLSFLQGWGAQLTSGPLVLAKSVVDGGQITFLPNLFRRETGERLIWRTPTRPQDEHQIFIWRDLSRPPRQVAIDNVRVDEKALVWTLPPESGTVLAIAVAFKGLRLGSWLSPSLPLSLTDLRPTSQLFALIRWLRVPVLNTVYGPVIMNLVAKDQASFVGGWLGTARPPKPLVHRDAEDGLETVVREFLWSYSERDPHAVRRVVSSLPTIKAGELPESAELESCLIRLGEDYPSVAFSLARSTKGEKQESAINSAAEGLAFQSQGGFYSVGMAGLSRHCARLLAIEPHVMEAALIAFEARLNRSGSLTNAQSFYLRRLGETISGRRSITAFLFFRLIRQRVA